MSRDDASPYFDLHCYHYDAGTGACLVDGRVCDFCTSDHRRRTQNESK